MAAIVSEDIPYLVESLLLALWLPPEEQSDKGLRIRGAGGLTAKENGRTECHPIRTCATDVVEVVVAGGRLASLGGEIGKHAVEGGVKLPSSISNTCCTCRQPWMQCGKTGIQVRL